MILAFGHKARQGKDTAGEAVVEYYNQRRDKIMAFTENWGPKLERLYPEAKLFKFADALYKVCREEYGMTEKDAPLLQRVGEGRRVLYGLNYWIDQLGPQIAAFKGIAVITDVRYTNEADWVNKQGGHCINVRRLNENSIPYYTNDRDPNFISEIQLDMYNYEFYITAKTGQAALVADQAVTIAEYVRALET